MIASASESVSASASPSDLIFYGAGMAREIPCNPYWGAQLDDAEYEREGMTVKKVSIYVEYRIIDEEDYMEEEDADPVKDILEWGMRALPHVVDFYGGIPGSLAIEYLEDEGLYHVSYDQDPQYSYSDASEMIADPDDDGNYPIIKREVEDDDGYYLVSGLNALRRIVLAY